jgi:tetratricopeptide (TPR) repeat protein
MDEQLKSLEKKLTFEKAPGKKTHPIPAPVPNLPDPKDRISVLPFIEEGKKALEARTFPEALKQFEKAKIIDPENRQIPYLIALALEGSGNYAGAIPLLEAATQRNPDNAIYRAALGEAYMKTGANDKAIVAFESALVIESSLSTVYLNLGNLYQKNAVSMIGWTRIDRLQRALKTWLSLTMIWASRAAGICSISAS